MAKIKTGIGCAGASRLFQKAQKGLFWMIILEFTFQSRALHLGPELGIMGSVCVTHSGYSAADV